MRVTMEQFKRRPAEAIKYVLAGGTVDITYSGVVTMCLKLKGTIVADVVRSPDMEEHAPLKVERAAQKAAAPKAAVAAKRLGVPLAPVDAVPIGPPVLKEVWIPSYEVPGEVRDSEGRCWPPGTTLDAAGSAVVPGYKPMTEKR